MILAALLLARRRPGSHIAGAEQCIFVANHASHLDAALILAMLPAMRRCRVRPVAAADYWTSNAIRRYLIHSIFRGVLVEREGGGLNPLEPVACALRQGNSLIVFPEGTRGPGGALQPLKPGIYHLARWFPDVNIVPVWIADSHRILPKGFAVPVPRRCSITFGAPMRWPEAQSQDEVLSAIRAAMEALRP